MSLDMLPSSYGHHHPHLSVRRVEKIAKHETKIGRKPTENGIVSGGITGAANTRGARR
jgi:hypothetical protein